MQPEISVIMPVYNVKEEFLRAAIESILIQTFRNFELIIIDDGSTEETKKIERDYDDERIIIIENGINVGLPKTLNIGLKNARGKYIARMDSDDISVKNRLEIQYNYMERHKNVVVAGGAAKILGSTEIRGIFSNRKKEQIQIELLFNNINLVHPTVMFRSSVLKNNNLLYNEKYNNSQDYEFWTRCIEYGEMVSIPQLLLYYRIHEKQITTEKKDMVSAYTNSIRILQLKKFKGEFSRKEIDEFILLKEFRTKEGIDFLYKLLKKMLSIAPEMYDKKLLKKNIWLIWLIIARKNGIKDKENMFRYLITYNMFRLDYLWFAIRYKILEKIYADILRRKLGEIK